MRFMSESADPVARFVFLTVMACWMVFAAIFFLRRRPARSRETRREWSSLIGMFIQAVGFAFVWFTPFERKSSSIVPMPHAAEISLAVLTIGIALFSLWMVNAGMHTLGKQWALAARLVEGHSLITRGPYRLVRNPIYAGMFGMMLATGLAITKWGALLAAVPVFLVGTYIRVRVEERLLQEQFGNEFQDYKRRVPAMIPGIW
jgi:protein-S-isoprenylcysteine O-methyltransferase Ste14